LEEAQAQAEEAVAVAEAELGQQSGQAAKKVTAVAWRVLGQVLAKVPLKALETAVFGQMVDAAACFARSLHLLEEIGESELLETAYTCRAWAIYEVHREHPAEAEALSQRALAVFTDLNLPQEVSVTRELVA
jgi:hypothetical protein